MRHTFIALVTVLVLLALPSLVEAHASSQSLEKQVGDLLIDIGYDKTEILPNEDVVFVFSLIKNPGTLSWKQVSFDEVEVEIRSEQASILKKTLTIEFPLVPFMIAQFPESAEYTMRVAYRNDGQTLVEDSLPVSVASEPSLVTTLKPYSNLVGAIVTIAIAGIVVLVLIWKPSRTA